MYLLVGLHLFTPGSASATSSRYEKRIELDRWLAMKPFSIWGWYSSNKSGPRRLWSAIRTAAHLNPKERDPDALALLVYDRPSVRRLLRI